MCVNNDFLIFFGLTNFVKIKSFESEFGTKLRLTVMFHEDRGGVLENIFTFNGDSTPNSQIFE